VSVTLEPAGRSSRLERSLDDRVALVTGGAVRLGRALVEALAARGARVAFTYNSSERRAKDLEAQVARIHGSGRALALRCDVRREEDVDEAFRMLDERYGRLDLLVNNAAIFERTPFSEITLDQWRRHLDVNLTGGFLCAKRAGDRMLAGGGGVIVNVACAGGVRPWRNHLAYCVSKAGVVMMTQVLALALAPTVRVNAIAPGPVLPPEGYDEAELARSAATTALGRLGGPDDVVRAVLFCWDSDYTTGALVPVEGGRMIL
jgi:pteridine reductase